jgi:hypothetical protein
MTTPPPGEREALAALVEAARLLGATQAKKGFGVYTEDDARFERAMHESIAKHSAALAAAPSQPEASAYYTFHRDPTEDVAVVCNVLGPPQVIGADGQLRPVYPAPSQPVATPETRVFDGPDAFASASAFQARLDAEIEAAGGLEAWRASQQAAAPTTTQEEPKT